MAELNIFEAASKQKLRFATARGSLPVEDLWDLKLTAAESPTLNLNDLAKGVNRALKESGAEESFVPDATAKVDKDVERLKLQLAVLKHIIDVKVADRDAKLKARAKAAERQTLVDALAAAEAREVNSKSADELRKLIAAHDATA